MRRLLRDRPRKLKPSLSLLSRPGRRTRRSVQNSTRNHLQNTHMSRSSPTRISPPRLISRDRSREHLSAGGHHPARQTLRSRADVRNQSRHPSRQTPSNTRRRPSSHAERRNHTRRRSATFDANTYEASRRLSGRRGRTETHESANTYEAPEAAQSATVLEIEVPHAAMTSATMDTARPQQLVLRIELAIVDGNGRRVDPANVAVRVSPVEQAEAPASAMAEAEPVEPTPEAESPVTSAVETFNEPPWPTAPDSSGWLEPGRRSRRRRRSSGHLNQSRLRSHSLSPLWRRTRPPCRHRSRPPRTSMLRRRRSRRLSHSFHGFRTSPSTIHSPRSALRRRHNALKREPQSLRLHSRRPSFAPPTFAPPANRPETPTSASITPSSAAAQRPRRQRAGARASRNFVLHRQAR